MYSSMKVCSPVTCRKAPTSLSTHCPICTASPLSAARPFSTRKSTASLPTKQSRYVLNL